MRSLCHKLFGLAVLLVLPTVSPSLLRAESASCDIPNVDQTGGDSNTSCTDSAFTTGPGATCPGGYCSTRRLNGPRRLTLAVKFMKPNKNTATFILPGK